MKKLLISTGGGDCPGLNAVIRGIYKAAKQKGGWEVWGSMEAFNGILNEPIRLKKLTGAETAGIHVRGGTILRTTNRGNPLQFPVQQADGSWTTIDRTQELVDKIKAHGFDAVVNIGGDGSQTISQALYEKGLPIVGVPKTIDNDLSATDLTFGYSTAVQIATDCLDKLVTTAESHHRIMIMEVMGRHAGWIALRTAIAGGAEICLIPEIPYDPQKILDCVEERYDQDQGFVNIVIAEGATTKAGTLIGLEPDQPGVNFRLGGVGLALQQQLKNLNCRHEIRTTILGHIQRGGTPIAFDRVLASSMGVKAFEMICDGKFGKMVSYKNYALKSVPLVDAIAKIKTVPPDHYMVKTARSLGISFGD